MTLQIAGPGSRSYAFVVDWHIRVTVALAWVLIGNFIYTAQWTMPTEPGSGYFLAVGLPSLLIYFLYHPVLEIAMHGRTPGKRIARVRLVTREGNIPGAGALLLRNVFRLFDSLPVAYLVGLTTVVLTDHHVRVGDLAAGTLLVMDHDSSASVSTSTADLIQELLHRWPSLEEHKRAEIARSLLSRLEPQTPADELARLGEADLRSRLMARLATR